VTDTYRLIAEPAFTGLDGELVTFAAAQAFVESSPLNAIFGTSERERIAEVGETLTGADDPNRSNPGLDDDILLTTHDGLTQWYARSVVEKVEA